MNLFYFKEVRMKELTLSDSKAITGGGGSWATCFIAGFLFGAAIASANAFAAAGAGLYITSNCLD